MSSTTLPVSTWIERPNTSRVLLTFATLSIAYYVIARIYSVYFGPLSKFPGPKSWAFSRFPRMRAMQKGDESFAFSKLHDQYGPVVRVGPDELSFTSGAQAWKDIYGFKKHGKPHPFKDPAFYAKSLNDTHTVISADDAGHSRQRKILAHAFSDKSLKEQEPLLKRWATLMRKKLGERAESGEEADMLKFYNCTTFDVMGDLTFSEGLNMLNDSEYSPWVKTIFASIKMATYFRAIQQLSGASRIFIQEVIFKSKAVRAKAWEHWRYTADRVDRRLKREPEHPDLWTKVLEKDNEEGGGLSEGEHYSNASLFMIAGTETTATALSGTTYHLLKNPQYMKKLNEEVRDAFEDFDDITLEGLARLKYLQAVLQEGLRMYPPVPIGLPRKTPKEGAEIDGQWVSGDTVVSVNQFATYRNADNFKDPYSFRPERWLGDPEYKDDHLDAAEPFSVGPRNCLGKNLAWHEMRVLLVSVLLHFDLHLCKESEDWSDQKIYTLWDKRPLMCTLTQVKA